MFGQLLVIFLKCNLCGLNQREKVWVQRVNSKRIIIDWTLTSDMSGHQNVVVMYNNCMLFLSIAIVCINHGCVMCYDSFVLLRSIKRLRHTSCMLNSVVKIELSECVKCTERQISCWAELWALRWMSITYEHHHLGAW